MPSSSTIHITELIQVYEMDYFLKKKKKKVKLPKLTQNGIANMNNTLPIREIEFVIVEFVFLAYLHVLE